MTLVAVGGIAVLAVVADVVHEAVVIIFITAFTAVTAAAYLLPPSL